MNAIRFSLKPNEMKIFSCQDYEKQVTLKHEKENQENEKIHIKPVTQYVELNH